MISNNETQRSAEWMRLRLGRVTGSKVYTLMSSGRKKDTMFSATGMTYIYQLAAERQFNPEFLNDESMFEDYVHQVDITTKAMQWGIDNEDAARSLFERITDKEVLEVSTCPHDTIANFAASPDGMIHDVDGDGNMGVLEIKCPNLGTFAQYKTEVHCAEDLKRVKPEYYWQMQAEMDCTGAVCGKFVAYCPWLSEPIHIAHIERVDDDIELMEEKVIAANRLIDNIINPKGNEDESNNVAQNG